MSYSSPTNTLDEKEICEYLNLSTKYGLPDLIRHIWQEGYEWGYERGYEDGKDIYE